jgi:glycosyltransferase involved in cell wall biosynthesis
MLMDQGIRNKPPKISIIAHALHAGGGVSVGKNIISSVCRALPEAAYQITVPQGLDYEANIGPEIDCQWIVYESGAGLIGRWFYDQFVLSAKIAEFKPDIVLCLGNRGLDNPIGHQILLIQDAHFFYPERYYERETLVRKWIQRYKKFRFARDLKRTAVLLCQTQTAHERIKQSYRFDREISILPNAVSVETLTGNAKISGIAEISENSHQTELGKFRIFYLARYYPHKNIELLLDLLSKNDPQLSDVVLYITICRTHHPGAARLLDAIKARGLERQIVNLGPLDQSQLGSLFRSMEALVMTSTLESFSGTYLEAMAFGCPILTSDLDFAHEICQDAALYFDPWSIDSLRAALLRLKNEPALAKELVANGYKVLAKSGRSWEENSKQLAKIIERQLATGMSFAVADANK